MNVYDLQGNYLQTISREGRGPGELIAPAKITMIDDLAYILNKSFNIVTFRRKDDQFEYNGTINLKYLPLDFCVINNVMYLQSLTVSDQSSRDNKHNILSYDIGNYDNSLFSFGYQYQSDTWFPVTSMTLNSGIQCDTKSNTVIQAFERINLIYGFNKDGEQIWTTKIDDFEFLKTIENKVEGTLSTHQEAGKNYNSIKGITFLDDGFFILQVLDQSFEHGGGTYLHEIKSYLINSLDGSGLYISNKLPLLLHASDEYLIFFNDEEYPKITISKY